MSDNNYEAKASAEWVSKLQDAITEIKRLLKMINKGFFIDPENLKIFLEKYLLFYFHYYL